MLLEQAQSEEHFDRQLFDAELERVPPTAVDAMMEHLENLRSVPGFTMPQLPGA